MHKTKFFIVRRYIWGIVLIALGISIFFPDILTKELFKYILAAALILAGLKMIFSKHESSSLH